MNGDRAIAARDSQRDAISRPGFSLLELVVVLFILVATAALLRPIFFDNSAIQLGENKKSPSEVVTASSMTVLV